VITMITGAWIVYHVIICERQARLKNKNFRVKHISTVIHEKIFVSFVTSYVR